MEPLELELLEYLKVPPGSANVRRRTGERGVELVVSYTPSAGLTADRPTTFLGLPVVYQPRKKVYAWGTYSR